MDTKAIISHRTPNLIPRHLQFPTMIIEGAIRDDPPTTQTSMTRTTITIARVDALLQPPIISDRDRIRDKDVTEQQMIRALSLTLPLSHPILHPSLQLDANEGNGNNVRNRPTQMNGLPPQLVQRMKPKSCPGATMKPLLQKLSDPHLLDIQRAKRIYHRSLPWEHQHLSRLRLHRVGEWIQT